MIDERRRQRVRVHIDQAAGRVTDWMDDHPIACHVDAGGCAFDIDVGPGDLRIVKIAAEQPSVAHSHADDP